MNVQQLLIERLLSAFRERDPDGVVRPDPAFFDLDAEGRAEAFEAARIQRLLEAALDPDGHSSTTRQVLVRIGRIS